MTNMKLRFRWRTTAVSVICLFILSLPDSGSGSLTLQGGTGQQSPTIEVYGPYSNSGGVSQGGGPQTDITGDEPLEVSRSYRRKRELTAPNAPAASSNESLHSVKNYTNVLNDSHNQLLVHWAGEQVIICLARDSKLNSTSTLFISKDYGSTFKNVSDALLVKDKPLPNAEKFYKHPDDLVKGLFIFTDVQNRYVFTTRNFGDNFTATEVDFVPDEVLFDPIEPGNVVAYEKSTTKKQMWVSQDYGVTWKKVQEHVKAVAWDESVLPPILYIQREEPSGMSMIIASESLFLDPKDTRVILSNVDEFQIKEDYKFATRRVNITSSLELLISHKQGPFLPAMFPSIEQTAAAPALHYHVADVSSDGQIFVCVVHNESLSNLYIGNVPEDGSTNARFSLSLERILFFKPNLTFTDTWLSGVTEEAFADLHPVDGLRGVYIASQLKPSVTSSGKLGIDQIISKITYDQGGEWETLKPPQLDANDNPIYCQYTSMKNGGNCSLHISQQLSLLYPAYRAVPIMSKKSAVGIILATGTVNTTLKGRLGVYMSNDGAVSWRQLLQGNYLYSFGDHGGVIVATKYYKVGDATNELIYSTDEGSSWKSYKFYDEKVRVLGLMTEPGENTTVFFIFASSMNLAASKHSWILIKVDFKDVFERNCTDKDYYPWSPWDSKPGRSCLLGQKEVYERRSAKANCYNGHDYVRPVVTKICTCERDDYECDFGFVGDPRDGSDVCIPDNSEISPGPKIEWCKPGDAAYNKTKGYRKVPGDKCQETDEISEFLPDTILCKVQDELEFMLVAKRDSVLRIDLNNFNSIETLPLPRVRSVIAIDYDMKNHTIYFSDVNRDQIMRLRLDGKSEPEHLVSKGLKSVEGLAFDWVSKNLYFSDGVEGRIEVIRTDSHTLGRMRKTVVKRPNVEKPRGLVVEPAIGYLFWTDWSADTPCIGRSLLDGSEATRIVQNVQGQPQLVKWPNGITIEGDRLYWVDAFLDRISTSDFDGQHVQQFLESDNRVSHPFAVGVYKNMVYWDDWTTRSIYFAKNDVNDVKKSIFLVMGNQSRLMDLKVFGRNHSQKGTNACAKKNCTHLCFSLRPDDLAVCGCPEGLRSSGNLTEECVCPDGKPMNENGTCTSICEPAENFFKCASSGYCIPIGWQCDGDEDCGPGDTSDEDQCDRNQCSQSQFQCKISGKCIPLNFRCDWDLDCGGADRSDEIECELKYPICNSTNHFQCDNGRCILKKWQCDIEDDCSDGSDERNCTYSPSVPTTCKDNEYKCEGVGEHRCLNREFVCDGDNDCISGSDESNCTGKPCPDWKFQCTSGECIMKSWKCDGDKDCLDGSDEDANCTTTLPAPDIHPFTFGNCSLSQMFECHSSHECIPIFWKCDNAKDCADGSDEADCNSDPEPEKRVTIAPLPQQECASDQWRCKTGECISISSRCDGGFPDCPLSDDEDNCDKDGKGCPKGYQKCGRTKVCIKTDQVCDKIKDCPNGEDEIGCAPTSLTKPNCTVGTFSCDETCKPLYMQCNNRLDCSNGEDEFPNLDCSKHSPVYQIAGISVERDELDSHHLEIEWWMDSLNASLKGNVEFLPSYCELESKSCTNATNWTKDRNYTLGSDDGGLRTYTTYSVTVFVRIGEVIYPPAIYKNFTTPEAEPTPPRDVTVTQPNMDALIVSWKLPFHPNGKVTGYDVHIHPPAPGVTFQVSAPELSVTISNKQSHRIFKSGVTYTFWVTAYNGHSESASSERIEHRFNGDIAVIKNLQIKDLKETTTSISWDISNENAESFRIILETQFGSIYQFQNISETNEHFVNLENLSPKTNYKMTIVPIYKSVNGSSSSITFVTKGNKLLKVKGLKVDYSKAENKAVVSWQAFPDKTLLYGVYYGTSTGEISSTGVRKVTKDNSIVLDELDACEDYLIDVGLVGSGGLGPLTETPQEFRTKSNDKSPPKNVNVISYHDSGQRLNIDVFFDASCDVLENPLSYDIYLRELTTNSTYAVKNMPIDGPNKLKTNQYSTEVQYGGRYQLMIKTSVNGSRFSSPVIFDGPPIPSPKELDQCASCKPMTIFWSKPDLPKSVTAKGEPRFVVWLSKDKSFNSSTTTKHVTTDHQFEFEGLIKDEGVYYVSVSVMDPDGLLSSPTPPMALKLTVSSPQIMISTSNALVIVLTIVIVILGLTIVLGLYVIRHKRLENSFLNFASSHYSTHSDAATFQQNNIVEEQDSPVIRGFSYSDDEPLLIA